MQMKEVTNKEELDFASQALFSKHPEMPCKPPTNETRIWYWRCRRCWLSTHMLEDDCEIFGNHPIVLWVFCLPLLIIYLVKIINLLFNVTWLWMCMCSMAKMAQVYLLQAWDLRYFPCWQLWWGKAGDRAGVLQRLLGTKICLWIIRYRFIFNYKQNKFVENDKKSVLNEAPGHFIGA